MNKYELVLTSQFKKELKLAKKQHKNIQKLEKVVEILLKGESLPIQYRDHQLINSTKFYNCRECHIESDWLLVYQIRKKQLILVLVELGSHSDLF